MATLGRTPAKGVQKPYHQRYASIWRHLLRPGDTHSVDWSIGGVQGVTACVERETARRNLTLRT